MSDWGECSNNLDKIKQLEPLTDREDELALMQFDYVSTSDILNDFLNHPVVKIWIKEGKYIV